MPAPFQYKIDEAVPADAGLNGASQNRASTGKTVTMQDVMEVYDTLPRAVRSALRSAAQPWAPHWAAKRVIEGWPVEAIVARIRAADRAEARRRDLELLCGKG
jgi:hypothetical protein